MHIEATDFGMIELLRFETLTGGWRENVTKIGVIQYDLGRIDRNLIVV